MEQIIKTIIKRLLSILALFITVPIFGQEAETRIRVHTVNDSITIREQFEFTTSRKDTTLNGNYTLQVLPQSKGDSIDLHSIHLTFNKGTLDGPFSRKQGVLKPEIQESYFDGYRLVQATTGNSIELKGNLKKDQPVGSWELASFYISNAANDSVLGLTKFQYDNGQLAGDFLHENKNSGKKLKGDLRSGRPHGKWRYELPNAISAFELHFEEGKLRALHLGKADNIKFSDTVSFKTFDLKLPLAQIIYFNSFAADLTEEERSDYKESTQSVLDILSQTQDFLSVSESPFGGVLPKKLALGDIDLQLPYYPVNAVEQETLANLQKDLATLKERFESVLNNSGLNLAQYKDEQLARELLRVQLLNEMYKEICAALQFFTSTSGVFVDRAVYANAKAATLAKARLKKFDFKDQMLVDSVRLEVANTEKYTGLFAGWFEELSAQLEKEEEQINTRLQELKITVELNDLEAQLVAQSKQLDSLFENFSLSFYDALKTEVYVNSFVTAKKRLMETYAEASKKEKIQLGEATKSCLDTLQFLFNKSPEIARFESEIFKAYHEDELNPVTWTKMETTKYERIYTGYKDKVVPYLFDELGIASKAGCEEFTKSVYRAHKILAYILGLEEETPHKINRKLRNSDSVTTYLEKIGFTTE